MSTDRDFDRIASSWLASGPTELKDRVLEAALDEVHLTKQRRRWSAPWRFTNMPMVTRAAVSAAAVLIAVVGVGGTLYLTSNPAGSGGKTSPTPVSTPVATSSPTPSPSPTDGSASRTFEEAAGPLEARAYRAGAPFPLPNLTFDVPTGWSKYSGVSASVLSMVIDQPAEAGIHAAFVNFAVPDALYADPCRTGGSIEVPNLGPTAADFVAALSKLPKFTVGPVTNVTVDGLPGREFDLTAPSGTGCTTATGLIQVWNNGFDVGGATLPGLVQHVIVVDVSGTRLVIEVLYTDPDRPFDDDINAIISSVRFK
jgi:hypothetical protein